VKDAAYGATGNGTTDDTAAVQNAVNAAATAGLPVYFPAGTYKVTSTIVLPGNLQIIGAGRSRVTIDGSGLTTAYQPILQAAGTTGTSTTLSANVAEQSLTCTVASAAAFTAGDYVRLESTASTGADGVLAGEILRILSISGTTITFETYTQDAYTTANSAKITKLSMVDGIDISGITIQGQINPATALLCGIQLRLCINARVSDIGIRYCHAFGIDNWESLRTRITNSDFYYCENDALGYAICNDGAAQDTVVTGCSFVRCKTAIEHTGSTGTGGVARRCIFAYNTILGGYRAGMQSHTGAEDLIFAFNTVDSTINDPTYSAAQCDGMNVWGTRMVIVGNVFRGMNRRMIYTGNTSAKALEVLIANNRCRGSSLEVAYGAGIEIDVSSTSYGGTESVIITGNDLVMNSSQNTYGTIRIEGPASGTQGGWIITNNKLTSSPQYPAILANNLTDFVISGNRLIVLGNGSNAQAVSLSACVDGVISSNVMKGPGTGTSSSGILAANCTDVACTGNRIKGFYTGIKTTGTSDYWAISANSLRGFASGGAVTSLVGSNNAVGTGANV
jgi:hypothetical protein